MRTLLVTALAASIALCAGCTTPTKRTVAFDQAEYEPFRKAGTGRIEGQAFMVRAGGTPVVAAGREVWLNPVTRYSTEWYQVVVLGHGVIEVDENSPTDEFARSTIADAEGRFEFRDLPEGEYYVISQIVWRTGSNSKTGGVAHAKVKVRNGQTTKAVVTR